MNPETPAIQETQKLNALDAVEDKAESSILKEEQRAIALRKKQQVFASLKERQNKKRLEQESMKRLNELISKFLKDLDQIPVKIKKLVITRNDTKSKKETEVKQVAGLLKNHLEDNQQRELIDFLMNHIA